MKRTVGLVAGGDKIREATHTPPNVDVPVEDIAAELKRAAGVEPKRGLFDRLRPSADESPSEF